MEGKLKKSRVYHLFRFRGDQPVLGHRNIYMGVGMGRIENRGGVSNREGGIEPIQGEYERGVKWKQGRFFLQGLRNPVRS